MARYSFPQFKVEIVDPIMTIDYSNVVVNHLTKTVTASVKFTTPDGSEFGHTFENIPTNCEKWDEVKLDVILAYELEKHIV
jgi:hypothetical protein